MSTTIPAIPASAGGAHLVTAINDRIRRINTALGAVATTSVQASAEILDGAHASRVNTLVAPDASIYVETDRDGLIYQVESRVWQYVAGTYQRTQSQLAALASTLGALDTGLRVEVTDYGHVLRWTGTGWQRAPEDTEHSDTFHEFGAAPIVGPGDTGWHACDGSTVSYLTYAGGLASRTLPNLASTPGYAKGGSAYSAAVAAAVLPAITDTPVTVNNPASGGTPAAVATSNSEVVSLAGGDPIANFSVVKWYRQ
jgi:hypothetical protein